MKKKASADHLFTRGRALANAREWKKADQCLTAAKDAGANDPRFYLEWSWTKYHVGELRRAHDLALRSMADRKPNPLFGMAYYNAARALEKLADTETEQRLQFLQSAADYYTLSLNFRDHPAARERRKKLLALDGVRERYEVKTSAEMAEKSFGSACEIEIEVTSAKSARDVCEKFERSFEKSRTLSDGSVPDVDMKCDIHWSKSGSNDDVRLHLFTVRAWEDECSSGGQGSDELLFLGAETKSGFSYARVMKLSSDVCDYYRQGSRPDIGEPTFTAVGDDLRLSMPVAYEYLQGGGAAVMTDFTRRYRLECRAKSSEGLTCLRLPLLLTKYHTNDNRAGTFHGGLPRHTIVEGATMRAEWGESKAGKFKLQKVEGDAPSCMVRPSAEFELSDAKRAQDAIE